MGIQATYLGMPLQLDDLDVENLAFFKHCAAHNFHLQKCAKCGLLRYPPTTACPWCMSPKSQWVPVDARGAVHSYTEVHHAIQPAFKSHTPYLILIVDLDTREGQADRTRGPARRRQPRLAGRHASAAGDGASRRHRHARPHGLLRRGAGPGPAAMDHRRGRTPSPHAVALSAGLTIGRNGIRSMVGHRWSGPEVLEVKDLVEPPLPLARVRIAVRAAGIAFQDTRPIGGSPRRNHRFQSARQRNLRYYCRGWPRRHGSQIWREGHRAAALRRLRRASGGPAGAGTECRPTQGARRRRPRHGLPHNLARARRSGRTEAWLDRRDARRKRRRGARCRSLAATQRATVIAARKPKVPVPI